MDSLIVWIVVFTTLGGVLSALAVGTVLLFSDGVRNRVLPWLVSVAIGAMLGAAFLELLPHAFEVAGSGGPEKIAITVLIGLLAFFLLEKMVLWRHCHTNECEVHDVHDIDRDQVHRHAAGSMILIGDGVHNMVDGVLIAAAFMTDVSVGVATSIAVAAHEIPQELGSFVVVLHGGFGRAKALLYNMLASLTTVIGGVVAYFSLSFAHAAVPYVLAVAASSFIYIAVADLIPGLHKRPEISATFQQLALILVGVSLIVVTDYALH